MKITQIPLLRDNYGYLVVCEKTNLAAIVDPSEADPVLRRVEQEKVELVAILNTHHHRDHTGGNEGLLARHKLAVYGHQSDRNRIAGLTNGVDDRDEILIRLHQFDETGNDEKASDQNTQRHQNSVRFFHDAASSGK